MLAALIPLLARGETPHSGRVIDAGSFTVLSGGTAIARETFSVTQLENGSVTESSIKILDGSKAEQKAQLELTPAGLLRRYEWHEVAPGKGHLSLAPDGDFLAQQSGSAPDENLTQRYALTPSALVLDNNFFVLRELLLWRYLQDYCKAENGTLACPVKPAVPARLPALVPLHRYSMQVSLRFLGSEKVKLGNQEADLLRFTLEDDTGEWSLWLDHEYRLVRLTHSGEPVEILREPLAAHYAQPH